MFSSFSAKKELPLSGCNIWLAPDLSGSKSDYKSLIEHNGGKYCSRLSGKVNFAVTNKASPELAEKTSKYSITIILDSFLRECVKSCTPLFPFTNPKHNELQKENYPNYISASSPSPSTSSPIPSSSPASGMQSSSQTLQPPSYATFNVYEYPSPPRSRGIRERLKSLSLISKHKAHKQASSSSLPAPSSPSLQKKTITKTPSTSSAQRAKLRNASRALCDSLADGEEDNNNNSINTQNKTDILPLQNLVFVVYGNFSIPRDIIEQLILTNGGQYVPTVNEEVTHILFGGEAMEVVEFEKAIKRKVHIVNEYFLRLMVKY